MTQLSPADNLHGCLLDNSGDYDPDCPFCQLPDDPFLELRRAAELAAPESAMTRDRVAGDAMDRAAARARGADPEAEWVEYDRMMSAMYGCDWQEAAG